MSVSRSCIRNLRLGCFRNHLSHFGSSHVTCTSQSVRFTYLVGPRPAATPDRAAGARPDPLEALLSMRLCKIIQLSLFTLCSYRDEGFLAVWRRQPRNPAVVGDSRQGRKSSDPLASDSLASDQSKESSDPSKEVSRALWGGFWPV